VKNQPTLFLEHPFPPVFDGESRQLILGSFPSVLSRKQAFYYGHPQNRFWPLIAAIYGEDIPQSIREKKALILRHHLALYDVISSCLITGSSDASIRQVVPSDLSLIKAPIKEVILNGQTAGKLYQRYQEAKTSLPFVILPSTSPANAAKSLKDLEEEWGKILLDN
jgi:double-stranded uracil-DNA glycosylase